ncbi:MAG: NAD-dependent epimerase/dehydratase family protein [Thermaceae bacterium]|nr:NAD-dependent epimerase/dehydratase family protein [Thermaceae bacterium]
MDILVLGGTRFIGRHIVETALTKGHKVTTFSRGQSRHLEGAESLTGDRDGSLEALRNRTWDAVIDVSGYVPRVVRQSAELLADKVGHYSFISTISVYQEATAPITEESPVTELQDPTVEEVGGETYGGLKVLCERVVNEIYPARSSVHRPTIVAGPFDPTDRFTYWPRRFRQGGKVLVPGRPDYIFQYIDARDFALFVVHSVEQSLTGTYNAATLPHTWGALVAACQKVTGSGEPVWAEEDWLMAQEVRPRPWSDLPLWLPSDVGRSMFGVRSDKAQAAGLQFRPLEKTVRDVNDWDKTRGHEPLKTGLTAEQEQELIGLRRAAQDVQS